jgi:hypothetical protein
LLVSLSIELVVLELDSVVGLALVLVAFVEVLVACAFFSFSFSWPDGLSGCDWRFFFFSLLLDLVVVFESAVVVVSATEAGTLFLFGSLLGLFFFGSGSMASRCLDESTMVLGSGIECLNAGIRLIPGFVLKNG